MKRLFLMLKILLCFSFAGAQQTALLPQVETYAQLRLSSNLGSDYVLQIRRLKFKLTSTPQFSPHWSYYIKFEMSSKHMVEPHLLDMRVGYKTGNFLLYLGQFLPDFGFERFQADTKIPTVERAYIINNFIPGAGMGTRDLGLQLSFLSKNKKFYSSIGIFNGRGIKQWKPDNSTFLMVNKSYLHLGNDSLLAIQTGYSLMFRHAANLLLPTILSDTILFSGNDLRLNIFARISLKNIHLQSEAIKICLNDTPTLGYYFLADYTWHKHQLAFSYEWAKDMNPETADIPRFYVGYNYMINGNDLKLSIAYTWQTQQ